MFWSGNYIAVRELNSLLKEENVTLSQVLEADDVLQECKAGNQALIQFLTRPEILAELVTLITEEPSKNIELSLQYRHASIACEVLTSQLPTLSDRLSMDTAQMNRLCDFINQEPPLNPLLASYFSKTIEMLLERSSKQDWYLYHIVCLRVLDFLRARRGFLPGLLRHLQTSAVADALRCFVRLNDLFNKIVMEWLEEHQFLESLIQIICGTYEPEPLAPPAAPAAPAAPAVPADAEKGQREPSEKADLEPAEKGDLDAQGKEVRSEESSPAGGGAEAEAEAGAEAEAEARARAAERMRGVAAANAAALLCDIILYGCAGEAGASRGRTAAALTAAATAPSGVRALLQGMFTAPPAARRHALVHGARVLLAMRRTDAAAGPESGASLRSGVELAVAPHLPLLHTALLQPPEPYQHEPSASEAPADGGGGEAGAGEAGAGEAPPRQAVGAARLQVAALLAALCASEVDEVATTMLTLGTPGVLLDMFFAHAHNNFLHAHVLAMVQNALANRAYHTQYARHLLEECDLLNRLMDVYEENENKKGASPRSGLMGHALQLLRALAPLAEERASAPAPAPAAAPAAALAERWAAFAPRLHQTLQQHDTPLGGYYPSENTYEVEGMVEVETALYNLSYDIANYGNEEDPTRIKFLELASQRMLEQIDTTWDDADADEAEEREEDPPEEEGEGGAGGAGGGERDAVREVLSTVPPWETTSEETASAGEGWAQFSADVFGNIADPFAASDSFGASDAFAANDAFAASDAFVTSDAFANSDAFAASDAFDANAGFKGEAFADEAFDSNAAQRLCLWRPDEGTSASEVSARLRALRLAAGDDLRSPLAANLRTALSAMTPAAVANIVNANMPPPPDPLPAPAPTATQEDPADTQPALNNTDAQPALSNTDAQLAFNNTDAQPTLNNTDTQPTLNNTDAAPHPKVQSDSDKVQSDPRVSEAPGVPAAADS